MGKLLALSVILGLFVIAFMNSQPQLGMLSVSIGQSTIDMSALGEGQLFASFMVGSAIEYLIIVGALYLFLRGVINSFGTGSR